MKGTLEKPNEQFELFDKNGAKAPKPNDKKVELNKPPKSLFDMEKIFGDDEAISAKESRGSIRGEGGSETSQSHPRKKRPSEPWIEFGYKK